MNNQAKLDQLFVDHKVNARVSGAVVGPTVTRYDIALGAGVRPEKIKSLIQAIGYALDTDSVRLVRGGIELPSERRAVVRLESPCVGEPTLQLPLGSGVNGARADVDLAKMPHMLVAGATGSGKSAWLNAALCTLIERNSPNTLGLILIDPKQVELTPYEDVPHLMTPIITDPLTAERALNGVVERMEERYAAMRLAGVRHIDDYNRQASERYPYIVIVIDELADLMMSSDKAVERPIVRIGQKGRAAGIHMVLATQRPSVDVVTGLIKSNVPARLAFATASGTDSRVVLDRVGAEKLLGRGDGLYLGPESLAAERIQGPFVEDAEVAATVARAVRRYGRSAEVVSEPVGQTRARVTGRMKLVGLVVALAIGVGCGVVAAEGAAAPAESSVQLSSP